MEPVLGVDLGASNVRAAVATEGISVAGHARASTPSGDASAVTETLCDTVEAACADAGVAPASVAAAGVGTIGPLDDDGTVVLEPVNLEGVDRVPLLPPLRDRFGIDRVVVHNDAVAGVIGESRHADAATDDMAYLTISTGIGAGVVVDGAVLSGHDGNVGEVGHFTLERTGGMPCGCGATGHWEAYCSGTNIPAYAARLHHEEGVETSLPVDSSTLTAADVFAADGTDPLATLTVDRVGEWNAVGVANLVQAFAPSYVAVGGAVALNNPDAVLDPIRERLPDRVMIEPPDIALTALGEDVVVRGALAAARDAVPDSSQGY